jgi:hypothetical protein
VGNSGLFCDVLQGNHLGIFVKDSCALILNFEPKMDYTRLLQSCAKRLDINVTAPLFYELVEFFVYDFDLWRWEELFVSKIGNETCSSFPGGCGGCDAKVH